MPAYTSSQRTSIGQFVSFTQAKESVAARILKNHDWNVERALDACRDMMSSLTSSFYNTRNKYFDCITYAAHHHAKAQVRGLLPNRGRSVHLTSKKIKIAIKAKEEAEHTPTKDSNSAREVDFSRIFAQRMSADHVMLHRFYQGGSGNGAVPPIQQNLGKLFDQYRDNPAEFPDKIGIDGAQGYLADLSVELDEVAHLALCELLQCPSIGEFERESFVNGWRSVSVGGNSYDSTSKQSSYMNTVRKRLASDHAYLKQVYRSAFKLAKPENQRSVPMDSALEFWQLFFSEGKGGMKWNSSTMKWLDLWSDFYKTVNRPVNKDLWNMVGELVMKIQEPDGETLDWWTEDGAWPMAIDEFVAQIRDKRKADSMDTS